jgi:hypothetical protein
MYRHASELLGRLEDLGGVDPGRSATDPREQGVPRSPLRAKPGPRHWCQSARPAREAEQSYQLPTSVLSR